MQGKTEEQQQGISPAVEGVLCSGEVELRRGTRRQRDPGEALVGGESSRGSLDRGLGHLDRGGAVESDGWMVAEIEEGRIWIWEDLEVEGETG